jgi:hypothetical protein
MYCVTVKPDPYLLGRLETRGFQLTLLGTRAVESGGSVGKLKRNEQPLFRGESAGFVNLPLSQHVAKLTGTSRSIPPE